MFLRRSIILLLIGIGIGSPWLVRDWLDVRGGRPSAKNSFVSISSWVDGQRAKRANRKGVNVVAAKDFTTSDEAMRAPYPLASKTKKIVEGFTGGNHGDLASLPPSKIPETVRSRAICEETLAHLTPELQKLKLKGGDPLVLRLFKEESELEVWMRPEGERHFVLFKVLRVLASAGRIGPKLREGDGQTPEGFYWVSASSLRPTTKHHLGLDVGYPNRYDQAKGRTGSELLLHGGSEAAGAFALTEEAMNEVYTLADAAFRAGQERLAIHLFPFRLSDKRMDQVVASGSEWTEGWINLKEGYDFFDNVRLPPELDLAGEHYAFRLPNDEK